MPQDGEQPQLKRRSSATTNGQDPRPLTYPKAMGRSPSERQTEGPYHDEIVDDPRQNTSAVRYSTTQGTSSQRTADVLPNTSPAILRRPLSRNLPAQRQPRLPRTTSPQSPRSPAKHQDHPHKNTVHWLVPLGVGMIAMLVLWMVGASAVAWGVQRYNDMRYGSPRTFQTDAVVGHGDSPSHKSHFIAVNLNRQAIIVEFKGGDPAKSVSYVAPVFIAGDGGDLAPVTLEFRDVTGDGKPDMIIHIHLPTQDQVSVFVNDGTGFRPPNSNDKLSGI